jgi:hypothetical protein
VVLEVLEQVNCASPVVVIVVQTFSGSKAIPVYEVGQLE